MSHHWDDFSKSLAEDAVPRRQSLRLLGAAIAGAVLSPWGFTTAWAAGSDPCKAFCRCSNRKQQNACLAACRSCNSDISYLCGSCAGGYACTDLGNDVTNCGVCNFACEPPGPRERGACVGGECVYSCVNGAIYCDEVCTGVLSDPKNCGACGNACGDAAPYCEQGVCTDVAPCQGGQARCNGACRDLYNDPNFCGTSCDTAVVCGVFEFCTGGACEPAYDWWSE